MYRPKWVLSIVAALALVPAASWGASVQIAEVPASWRLENYAGSGAVNLWFTPASCTNGHLTLPASATTADSNRLWALVMMAKTSNRSIFIFYDNTSAPTTCTIISFGMDG